MEQCYIPIFTIVPASNCSKGPGHGADTHKGECGPGEYYNSTPFRGIDGTAVVVKIDFVLDFIPSLRHEDRGDKPTNTGWLVES